MPLEKEITRFTLISFVFVRYLCWAAGVFQNGVLVDPDSGTYRTTFLNFDSVLGFRGPSITIPFALMPNDFFISLFQVSFVTLMGVLLIKQSFRINNQRFSLYTLCIFVVLNAQTVAAWDIRVLSHSLSIGYLLLVLYSFIEYRNTNKSKWLIYTQFLIFIASLGRPNLLTLLFFGFLLNIMGATSKSGKDSKSNKSSRSSLKVLSGKNISLSLLLLLASLIINSELASRWSPPQPAAIVPYILNENLPIAQGLIQEAKSDISIPECAFPPQPLKDNDYDFYQNVYLNCPEGVDWLNHKFGKWYVMYLLGNPEEVLKQLAFGLTVSNSVPSDYGSRFPTLIPDSIAKLFMSSPKFQNNSGSFTPIFWLVLALICLRMLSFKIKSRNKLSDYHPVMLNSFDFVFLIGLVATWFASLVYMSHGDSFRLYIDLHVATLLSATYIVSKAGLIPIQRDNRK